MQALRSALTAGMAAVTATAVVAAPAINPGPAAAAPVTVSIPVHNTAASSPLTSLIESFAAAVPNSLAVPSDLSAIPNSDASFPMPTAAAIEPLMGNHPSTGLIMDAYNAIEPWVAWGVDLAAWAIGWVPWVGLLSYPIRVVYYTGEPIVESLFQVAQDVVKLNFSNIPSALVDGVVQAATNFIYQIAPPLPPGFPSLPFSASNIALASTSTGLTAGPAAALSGRALTLPNGSNLADFGKKITEGIQDLVDRSALKNFTSGNPLSLTGTPEKVAKDEIKPTVAIEAAEVEEADGTTLPPAVDKKVVDMKFDRGSLQSLREVKLPTVKGNDAWQKAKETKDADPQITGEPSVTPPSAPASVPATTGFVAGAKGIFGGKLKATFDKQAQKVTGTPSNPDATQTGPKDPKPRDNARTGKGSNNDTPAPKRVRSHNKGH